MSAPETDTIEVTQKTEELSLNNDVTTTETTEIEIKDEVVPQAVTGEDTTKKEQETGGETATEQKEDKPKEQEDAIPSDPEKDGYVTVFQDPLNYNVIHPLMHKWCLWYTKPGTNKNDNWADLLKPVCEITSVEQFWGVYNNIAKASQIAQKSDYHLFKAGVRPEWEDENNSQGGRWSFEFKSRPTDIDEIWLATQLAVIGEVLEDEGDNEIMGAVVNSRRLLYRVGVWTRTYTNDQVLRKIGERLKKVLKLSDNEPLVFTAHRDAATHGSSRARGRITI